VCKDQPSALAAFTERDDLLVVTAGAAVLRGRAAVAAYIESYVASEVVYDWHWDSVQPAGADDIAWLFAEGTEIKSTRDGKRRLPYRATLLVRREDDDWRIVQFHGSSPRGTSVVRRRDLSRVPGVIVIVQPTRSNTHVARHVVLPSH
jgi:ketosteroid isomerase-like protein